MGPSDTSNKLLQTPLEFPNSCNWKQQQQQQQQAMFLPLGSLVALWRFLRQKWQPRPFNMDLQFMSHSQWNFQRTGSESQFAPATKLRFEYGSIEAHTHTHKYTSDGWFVMERKVTSGSYAIS